MKIFTITFFLSFSFLFHSFMGKCSEIYFTENNAVCLSTFSFRPVKAAFGGEGKIENFSLSSKVRKELTFLKEKNCLMCSTPIINAIDGLEDDRVEPSWLSVFGATSYEYEIGLLGFLPGAGQYVKKGTVNNTWVFVQGLQPNTAYSVVVRAFCGNGETSGFSVNRNFVTSPFCGGKIHDLGGVDNDYPAEVVLCQTLCPGQVGEFVSLEFESFSLANCCSRMEIYNHNFPGISLLGTWEGDDSPGIIEATNASGCLSLRLIPEGLSGFGYEATVSCVTCPQVANLLLNEFNNTYTLHWSSLSVAESYNVEVGLEGFVPGTGAAFTAFSATSFTYGLVLDSGTKYDVYIKTICENGTESDFSGPFLIETKAGCGDLFYDPGGQAANYNETGSFVYVLCPEPGGGFAEVEFNDLDIDPCCANLTAEYSTNNGLVTIPIQLDGPLPEPITSNGTNRCLTLNFDVVNTDSVGSGWEATFNCSTCPPVNRIFFDEIWDDLVRISWDDLNISSILKWEIGFAGFTPGTGTAVSLGNISSGFSEKTISGFSPFTQYDIYISMICNGDAGQRTGPFTFTTAPDACGSVFSDPGGTDNEYVGDGMSHVYVICPNSPTHATFIDFIEFETAPFDQLTIFNGSSVGSPKMGSFSGNDSVGQFVSNHISGCLTFEFETQLNTMAKGWKADLRCEVCKPVANINIGDRTEHSAFVSWTASPNALSYDWEVGFPGFLPGTGAALLSGNTGSSLAQHTVAGLEKNTIYEIYIKAECGADELTFFSPPRKFATNATCGDLFYDPGGPNAPYGHNENITTTICPEMPNQKVNVVFNIFNVQFNLDKLFVYGDNGLIGSFSGSFPPPPFESQVLGECLDFRFISNGSIAGNGWEANVFCTPVDTDEINEERAGFKIFPNPTSASASVVFESPHQGVAIFEIYNQLGNLIDKKTIETMGGVHPFNLDMESYAAGVYMVALKGDFGTAVERVVKY